MGPGWRAPSAALVGGSVALFGALRRAALALPRPAAVRSRPGRVWRWRNLLVSFAHSVLAGLWALFRYRGWMGARGVMPWAAQAQLSHSPGGRNTALFPLPPPVHRGGIGVLGLYPRSSAHPASLPAAFGSPRSCSLTSRTGTASQGICWSASPQVSAHPPPRLRARLSLQAPRVPSSPPSHSRSFLTLQATSSTTASTSSSTSSPARPGSTWCTTPW